MTIDNATQIEFWNGETGRNWVNHDALMEAMLQPLGESVMDALAPQPGEHVLDIGCGCGHTSLSLAQRVGAAGSVTGIDISAPMLTVARHLAAEQKVEVRRRLPLNSDRRARIEAHLLERIEQPLPL